MENEAVFFTRGDESLLRNVCQLLHTQVKKFGAEARSMPELCELESTQKSCHFTANFSSVQTFSGIHGDCVLQK